jgi:hypothetical protein
MFPILPDPSRQRGCTPIPVYDGGMWLLFPVAFAGPPPTSVEPPPCLDASLRVHRQLHRNARADQRERRKRQYEGMAERDAARLHYVHEQFNAQRVCTVKDAWNAAVVLQHSARSGDHLLAWSLFQWACEEGVNEACSWVGLAWDRHLVSKGERQWYGTQWVARLDPDTNEHLGMCLVALDGGATDVERVDAHRDPLSVIVTRTFTMNEQQTPPEPTLETLAEAGLICEPTPWE